MATTAITTNTTTTTTDVMRIIELNGEDISITTNDIVERLSALCDPVDENYIDSPAISSSINKEDVHVVDLADKIFSGLKDKTKSLELDCLMAQEAASRIIKHPDYDKLAARIMVSSLHESTKNCREFSQVTEKLHNATHPTTQAPTPLINPQHYKIVMENADRLNQAIDYKRDYAYNYFGIQTLKYSYLAKIDKEVVERPQHMLMRVAVWIHQDDIDSAIETYELMSKHFFTHASPTLFNAGCIIPQLSSCYLVALKEDSVDGIFQTLSDTALISKEGGGVGLHFHNMRAKGGMISSSNGKAPGMMPFLKIFNAAMKCISQCGNKRKGAAAIYLEPWHADIKDVIECRKNTGNEELRTRELFPALWIPDEFMRRVHDQKEWTLMCPSECPGLSDVYGKEFDELYKRYEAENRGKETIDARKLWRLIVNTKNETGVPFICFKDNVNNKSNHSNIGTIKSSNLCTEITQYSDSEQTAVCNLASVAVNKCISISPPPSRRPYFDFEILKRVVKVMTRNLNKIIDINSYPTEKAKKSNMSTRPIGLGIQGLANVFFILRMPFDSEEAQTLNRRIFETIYYAALEASCELAQEEGTYECFDGSPVSNGILQFDLCQKHDLTERVVPFMERESIHNWETLKLNIKEHGVRNSLLVAPMPTASTAQILGNAESIEPFTSNMYNRNVIAGAFQVINESLVRDLIRLGLWVDDVRNQIFAEYGSIQNVDCIPDDIKSLYKTAWEIPQRTLIDMAADRGMFVDQSQSLNLFVPNPSFKIVNAMLFHAWKSGIKTIYYLRSKGAAHPVQFTVDKQKLKPKMEQKDKNEDTSSKYLCSLQNKDECAMCGS